jgi:hypothetical protein
LQLNRFPYSVRIDEITGGGIDLTCQGLNGVQSLSYVIVGRRAVAAGRTVRQFSKQKVIFTDPLNWLNFSQYRCTCQRETGTTLMRRSFKVIDLFSSGLRLSIGATDFDRASIPWSKSAQLGIDPLKSVISCASRS